jgi:hypothetical protein
MKNIGAFSIAPPLLQGGKAGILDTVLTDKGKPQEA